MKEDKTHEDECDLYSQHLSRFVHPMHCTSGESAPDNAVGQLRAKHDTDIWYSTPNALAIGERNGYLTVAASCGKAIKSE